MTGSRSVRAARSGCTRTRLSLADKYAIVCQLRRLGGGGRPLGAHVRAVAERYDVSVKTVYHWLNDPRFASDECPELSPTRRRFEITTEHLAVVAQEQNMFTAWEKMRDAGLLQCSYDTFARAMRERTDPTLVAAALQGYEGLTNNRLYLKWVPPHRCHTYHVDHTKLDLWVFPSHKHRTPIRPHITVVVDGATGLMHAVPWTGDVNGDMIAAALVDAAVEKNYYGVPVGGVPEQVIFDNAAAHFGPAMRAGVERLGWIPAPTAAYSSWQNGKAERAIGLLNQRLSNRAPGATNAGTTRTGAQRHVARQPKDVHPDQVWGWKAFVLALQAEVDAINTTITVDRLGGLTRLEAYAADETERRPIAQAEASLAMLTSGDKTYTATKNGINFDGVDYVDSCLEYGRKYLIRYLPTQRDFINVRALNDEHVGFAYNAERLPKHRRDALMAQRARQERDAKAIEYGVQVHRRHLAAVDNAGVDYGTDDESPAESPAASNEAEATAVSRMHRAHGVNAPERTPAGRSRGRKPRVPATPPPPPQVTDRTRSRLEDKFGGDLPSKTSKKDHNS